MSARQDGSAPTLDLDASRPGRLVIGLACGALPALPGVRVTFGIGFFKAFIYLPGWALRNLMESLHSDYGHQSGGKPAFSQIDSKTFADKLDRYLAQLPE